MDSDIVQDSGHGVYVAQVILACVDCPGPDGAEDEEEEEEEEECCFCGGFYVCSPCDDCDMCDRTCECEID